MSNTRPATGSQRRHRGEVAGERVDVAAGVDDLARGRRLEPAGELGADAAAGRVDDDEVGRGGEAWRSWRRRPRSGRCRGCRAHGIRVPPRRRPAASTASAEVSTPTHRATRRRSRAGRSRPRRSRGPRRRPGRRRRPSRGPAGRARPATAVLVWKNDLGPSSSVASPTRIGSRVCSVSSDLGVALEHRLVLGVQVRGDHARRGQVGEQPGERGAQVGAGGAPSAARTARGARRRGSA